jgi:hypothetical protein
VIGQYDAAVIDQDNGKLTWSSGWTGRTSVSSLSGQCQELKPASADHAVFMIAGSLGAYTAKTARDHGPGPECPDLKS